MKKLSERRGRGKSPGGGIHIQGERERDRWFTYLNVFHMSLKGGLWKSPCNVKLTLMGGNHLLLPTD